MPLTLAKPPAAHPPLGLYSRTVTGLDGEAVRAARIKHLGGHRSASTTVFVSQRA